MNAENVLQADAPKLLVNSLIAILRELREFVAGVPQAMYCEKLGPLFCNASIGGHVRHSLDHVRALAVGAASGTIEYDHRERNTLIEREPDAAIAELDILIESVLTLSCAGDRSVCVEIMPASDGHIARVHSRISREIGFALSHTIHHNAMIRMMAYSKGIEIPGTFGFAPATIEHLEHCACKR